MESRDKDRLDQWLDVALPRYGDVEPRTGIEGRILANLAAQQASLGKWRWAWALSGAVAVACVIAVLWVWSGVSGGGHRDPSLQSHVGQDGRGRPSLHQSTGGTGAIARAQSGNRTGGDAPKTVEVSKSPALEAERNDTLHGKFVKRRTSIVARRETAPKLNQFPSQRPLSEQERLLAEYVTQFPDQAKLVAQEQAQTEKEMDKLYAENAQKSSQHER